MNKQCCDKCKELGKRQIDDTWYICTNADCSCHHTVPAVRGALGGKGHYAVPAVSEESWEIEFDEKYQSFQLCDVVSKGDYDRLKSFISAKIAEAEEKSKNRLQTIFEEGFDAGYRFSKRDKPRF
jgi:hypothetical protein